MSPLILFLVFHRIAPGNEVFLGAEKILYGIAGHGGQPVVELALVLVIFEILDLLPDLGQHRLADILGIFGIDAHAQDQAEDEAAVDALEFEPRLLVLGFFKLGQQGDPRLILVFFAHVSCRNR